MRRFFGIGISSISIILASFLFIGINSANAQFDYGLNIDEISGDVSGYAWSEYIGWIDFNTVTYNTTTGELGGTAFLIGDGTLTLTEQTIEISGDCTPTCGGFGVTLAPSGDLLGMAWNEVIGFIEFSPDTYGGVSHDDAKIPSLSGYAWNDNIGWISMSSGQALAGGGVGGLILSACARG